MIWKAKEDSPREVRKEDLPDKDLPRTEDLPDKDLPRTEDLPGKHIEQQTEEPVQDLRERHIGHPPEQRRDTDLPEIDLPERE